MIDKPLLLLFTLLASCTLKPKLTTIGPLTIPSEIQAGDKVIFEYHKNKSNLSGEKGLEVTLYYVVKNKIYATPILTGDSGEIIKASFTLPDTAQAYALKFSAIHTDTGRYVFPVYGHSGKPIPGALAAESMFYIFRGSFVLRLHAVPDIALHLIEKDLNAHPALRSFWEDHYWNLLLKQKKEAAYSTIQKQLEHRLRNGQVKKGEYLSAYNLYKQMNEPRKADSIMKKGIQMFPEGPLYQLSFKESFITKKKIKEKIADYEKIKQKAASSPPAENWSDLLSFMAIRIAIQFEEEGNYEGFVQYASQVDNFQQLASMYNSAASKLAKNDKQLKLADSISKISLQLIQKEIDFPGTLKPTYLTDTSWKDIMRRSYAMYADTYALILAKQGKYKEAASYQQKVVYYLKGMDAEKNAHYVEYLLKLGNYKEAQKQLEKFFVLNKITPGMESDLKAVYIRSNPSKKDYKNYRSQLEKKVVAHIKLQLQEHILDIPALNFTLPDLKGNKISLKAFRGKVVVLEFWASWSNPSRASLPGMQNIIKNFKSDSSVVFLLINTLESSNPQIREKQLKDFMKQNNYSFHLLLDQPRSGQSSQYQVVRAYDVISIPTLFIIDPGGIIRFKKSSFSNYPPSEVIEVSSMIDLAKNL